MIKRITFYGFAALMLVGVTVTAQVQLRFNISAKYQPTNWSQMQGPSAKSIREFIDYWPVFQADIGMRNQFERSPWFAEADLSLRHTRREEQFETREIDPYYGFVYNTPYKEGDIVFSDRLYYAGLKLGGGYRLLSRNRKHALLLSIGLQCHLPLFSESVGRFFNDKLYRNEDFGKGVYYGFYFRPAYEFALSEKASNPWRLSVYLEADALIHHQSEIVPKFLWGGGIGVGYRLNH